jgi:hypothetical protein
MNLKKIVASLIAGLFVFVALISPVFAVAPWNVSGNYEVTFFLTGDTTPYTHHVTLSQTGITVTGDGGYPAIGSESHHWNITSGTVTTNTINLTANYDLGAVGTTMSMTGTIASDGTVTGTWSDNFEGSRSGTWSITKGVSVPLIHTPANNSTLTTSAAVKIDWTDAIGANSPIVYQYEAYSDANYTSLVYSSLFTLSDSEIPTPGTPPGDYYVRVRAQNASADISAWSNGASNPYKITVTADSVSPTPTLTLTPTLSPTVTPILVGPPTNKDLCKDNGWKTFNNPTFKNQGACVSYVQSNDNAGKRN